MVASFKMTFYPFDIQNKARRTMNHLVQNLRDHKEGFQKYVADFQLATAQIGIKDKETLIEAFTTGLDPSLGQMVLSVKDIPSHWMSGLDRQASSMLSKNKSLLSKEEVASGLSFPKQHKTLMPWTLMPFDSPP